MTAAIPTQTRDAVDADGERELGHLKRLLLVDERQQIAALRRAVSTLEERLGNDNRFCRAVADSIVVALKVAEIEQHRDLTGVMAPIVVAGIRREIAESKDIMVAALYPIVGRLVATAVAQALRQLLEDINRRIESVLSPRSLRLRVKALVTRRPLAELLLAEALQNRIDTLLLLDRASGAVLASSSIEDGRVVAETRATDSLNLLGGLMAAIIEFANDALRDSNGELRTLDFGGRSVLLRASPLTVVAAIGRGPTSAGLSARVDEAFLSFLEQHSVDAVSALVAMHERFLAEGASRPWNRRISALTLLGPACATLLVSGAIIGGLALRARSHEADLIAQLAQVSDLSGYPVSIAIDRAGGTVTISGLMPDPDTWKRMRQRVEQTFPDLRVEARVAILSDSPEARRTHAALQASETRADELRERMDTLSARLAARLDGMATAFAELDAGRRQAEAASRDAQVALATRIDRIEHETNRALADRPSRTEVAQSSEAQATTLRERTDSLSAKLDGVDELSARLDAVVPALAELEAGRKRAEPPSRDAQVALATRIDRIERETNRALADRPSRTEVAQQDQETTTRLAEFAARLDTPRRHLLNTIERTAIFFKDDAAYRDPAKAMAALESLADALRAEPGARLRVLGFADSLGTAKANLKVGRLRAERVAGDLGRLGIEGGRLRVAGISQAVPISDDVGGGSANRRVTFELIYADE